VIVVLPGAEICDLETLLGKFPADSCA
jgi:hypothetical protein